MRWLEGNSMMKVALAGYFVLLKLMIVQSKVLAPIVDVKDPLFIIPGQYIIVLNDKDGGAQQSAADSHQMWLMGLIQGKEGSAKVEHKFEIDGMCGYSGKFSDEVVEAIRERPEVKYVEPDQLVYALDLVEGNSRRSHVKNLVNRSQNNHPTRVRNRKCMMEKRKQPNAISNVMKQSNAPWGLSRVSHSDMPTDLSKYRYPKSSGKGVDVYVIDTGINIGHADFGGRAHWGVTIPIDDVDIDGNGHGTHCAGIIAGRKHGIAKKANVVAVKVLRTNGFGTNADVIKGVEWTIKTARRTGERGRKSVANMSLGGGRSITLESAVNQAVKAGISFAVAAGNDNEDACDYSPAGAEGAITVGASTNRDQMTFFSNYGSCVDLFAPGMDITSTWIGSRHATNTISGTSMASPHVAGVMALYLGEKDYRPQELKEMIVEHANKGLLEDIPYDTVNRLLSTHRLLEALG